jgi:hypothetical protein
MKFESGSSNGGFGDRDHHPSTTLFKFRNLPDSVAHTSPLISLNYSWFKRPGRSLTGASKFSSRQRSLPRFSDTAQLRPGSPTIFRAQMSRVAVQWALGLRIIPVDSWGWGLRVEMSLVPRLSFNCHVVPEVNQPISPFLRSCNDLPYRCIIHCLFIRSISMYPLFSPCCGVHP